MNTWPVVVLLTLALVPSGFGLAVALAAGADTAAIAGVFKTPGVSLSLAYSVATGVISTVLSLLLAHGLVAVAVTGGWHGRLTRLSLPLLAIGHLALGIGLALVLAPSGLLLRLVSPWLTGFELPPDWHLVRDPYGVGLIAGLTIKETCFLVMALTAALRQVPAADLNRQATSLGYGALKGWFVGVAPRLQKQIGLPLAAVLVYGLGNVDLALTLGPDLPPTFAVVLWRWLLDAAPDSQALAHAGALVLLTVTLGVLALGAAAHRLIRQGFGLIATSGRRRQHERWVRRLISGTGAAGLALGMLAIVSIGLRAAGGVWAFPALLPSSLSSTFAAEASIDGAFAGAWGDAFATLGPTFDTSIGLALATAALAVVLVLLAGERVALNAAARRRVGQWLFVPLLLPQMTFLFGVQVVLVRLGADGTLFAVGWLHLIFALPYVCGVLAPARAALDPRLAQVAASLGAGRVETWWRVTRPLLTRATLLAAALGTAVSLSLYLPTLFAGAGRVVTAATEAAAAAGAGSLRVAAAHAILLTAAPLTAFAVAYGLGAVIYRKRRDVP